MSIHDKIQALMAKTVENGCTENEAMAAAAKVKELMAKYGDEIGQELEGLVVKYYANSLEMEIMSRMWEGICRYCRVSVLRTLHKDGLEFIGPKSGTIFAEWLNKTLLDFVLRETAAHMKGYARGKGIGDTKREKLSFAIGCAERINVRLKEASEQWEVRTYLKPWADKRGIVLVKGSRKNVNLNHGGMAAGAAAGDGARWDRPVEGSGGEVRMLK